MAWAWVTEDVSHWGPQRPGPGSGQEPPVGESEGLCDPRVRGSETRGRSTAAGKEQHLEAWGATQRTSAGPCVGSRPNALSWPGLPLARLRVLGTPGSHDGEFWATGTGRHWGHRLRQGPFLLPREGGLSASPGASAHRFLRFGEGSRPRSAPLHCHEGLGQRRRRRQAPSGHCPLDKGATYRPTQERAIPAAPAQGGPPQVC